MSETLEYIDNYFNGGLTAEEKKIFEDRCEADPAFAEDIAFYIQARAGLKQELHEQKRRQFEDQFKLLSASGRSGSRGIVRKLFPYAAAVAAACVIIFFGWQFFKPASSQELADNYINENMKVLSVSMGSSKDSLAIGIAAYNNKNYKEAESIFSSLASQYDNAEAIKNLGILYLVTGDYDRAIAQFDKLSKDQQLFANPGVFYEALALIKRDREGDKAKAKTLLEEVVSQDLPGKNEAAHWINKI
jgi:tetratricopeptide (TPR) repeat protein